jgi:chromate transporter
MSHQPPKSLWQLYKVFTLLALQGFGGILTLVQAELVDKRRWLSEEEFIEDWAVAQLLPGPNVINLSMMVGMRYFGWRGATVVLAGLLVLPFCLMLLVGMVYARFADHPGILGALRGLSAVTAGLVIAAGLKLFAALRNNPLGLPMCIGLGVVVFFAVAIWRLPLAAVLVGLGFVASSYCWYRLKPPPQD